MSNEMRIFAFIAICLFMAWVSIVGHVVLTRLKAKHTNSLEGENQDVNP
jgi:hypothetical protein